MICREMPWIANENNMNNDPKRLLTWKCSGYGREGETVEETAGRKAIDPKMRIDADDHWSALPESQHLVVLRQRFDRCDPIPVATGFACSGRRDPNIPGPFSRVSRFKPCIGAMDSLVLWNVPVICAAFSALHAAPFRSSESASERAQGTAQPVFFGCRISQQSFR
jgi:hypothetical protein